MQFDLLRQKLTANLVEDLKIATAAFELAQGELTGKASVGEALRDLTPTSSRHRSALNLLSWFWHSGLAQEFEDRFGNPPLLLTTFCTIRRHLAAERSTHVNWHLDANFVGFGGDFAVFWVPLDPVGTHSPGLDFYFPEGRYRIGEIGRKWMDVPIIDGRRTLDDAGIKALFDNAPARRMTPKMLPGDVLLFDEIVPHRTQYMDRINQDRTAVEFRVTSVERPVPRHVAFGSHFGATKRPSEDIRLTPLETLLSP